MILNRCLTFCALKWKCLKGPRKGQILDSNTFAQRMKELFIVFGRQGIKYDYKKDFNSNGEFHGVVLSIWVNQKKEEPSFGTYANRAEMDEEADKKLRECASKGIINPFQIVTAKDAYLGLARLLVWIFGRYLCTRGRKEIAKVNWPEMEFSKYETGPDKGTRYVQFIPDEDKANRRTMQNPSIDPEKKKEENP